MSVPAATATAGLRVLAVDDEPLALADLERMLRASPSVGEVVTASGGEAALELLGDGQFDLLLLDVRMPGLDGVRLARVVRRFSDPPALVFVTAHESAAVEAFALQAVDYLLKPVATSRLEETLRRVGDARAADAAAAAAAGRAGAVAPSAGGLGHGSGMEPPGGVGTGIAAGTNAAGAAGAPVAGAPGDALDGELVPVDNVRGGGTRLVRRSSILYVEAYGDYVRIVADDGRFLLRARLGDLEQRWAPHGFVRVHRGYLVDLRRAVELHPQLGGTAALRFADGSEVPVARRQVGELRRRLRA
ncbi:LytR/AlgR family response regulator transcription factor [Patulibacter americanus]|uniref:LytR/AlgR family response regulator transcription factor n=1 Tax=Patulibacter americanus TaxID=588672 RepID=UPI0003B4BD06|nr:LytTR family DNA-binding domain-containing protein [Patulibacter americanus]